jgi:mannosyltransferase OCH1-like enzyme
MKFPYLLRAAKGRKWANMSNLVRLYALFTQGGVYLDTDVEVIKPFDDLLKLPAFLGCEADEPRVNNAVYGSEPGHPFLFQTMHALMETYDGLEAANWSSPMLTTRLLREHGLKGYRKTPWRVADVVIFPTPYFYPYYFGQTFTPECITRQTYTIHYWQKRWCGSSRPLTA